MNLVEFVTLVNRAMLLSAFLSLFTPVILSANQPPLILPTIPPARPPITPPITVPGPGPKNVPIAAPSLAPEAAPARPPARPPPVPTAACKFVCFSFFLSANSQAANTLLTITLPLPCLLRRPLPAFLVVCVVKDLDKFLAFLIFLIFFALFTASIFLPT